MRDRYHMFLDDRKNIGHILRQHGDINSSTSLFEDTGLTVDQCLDVNAVIIETYERGFNHALAAMKDFLDRKELNNVRARLESCKDSTNNQGNILGASIIHKGNSGMDS